MNRIRAAWACLRGRPVMFRWDHRSSPIEVRGRSFVAECRTKGT